MKPAVTQIDIARKLGISQSAVGSVVGSYSTRSARIQLRPEMRKRVLDTAREMGYRPARHAQLMRKRSSGVIGMVQFGGSVQVSAQRAMFAAKAIHEAGYQLLAGDVLWHRDGFRAACEAMLDARVEGVVLCNPWSLSPPNEVENLLRAGVPVVGMSGARLPGVPQVRSDVRQGMRDLTRHLIQLGHRKLTLMVAWVTEDRSESFNWNFLERIEGFRDAATQAGLTEREAEVIALPPPREDLVPYRIGKVSMDDILKRSELPGAVLCSNDDWAIGALSACGTAGLRVPQDVAITGFDNSMIGEYSFIPLTTVSQQPESMAGLAVEILLRMIRGETLARDKQLTRLPCELVIRQSCGALLRRDGN